MKKAAVYLMVLALVFSSAFTAMAGAENSLSLTETDSQYTLDRVVILSRHNIRSPLSAKGSVVSDITPHEWFTWTSNTGELSLRGAMLEVTMGQYFRLWLEKEGLFPENYLPGEGAVRFYANALQRTQATAHYFSTGLLPVAVVPVERHAEYNQSDDTFLPLIRFMQEDYEKDIRDEIGRGYDGRGLEGLLASLSPAADLLIDVLDAEQSEAYQAGTYGSLKEGEITLSLEEGKEPSTKGPIRTLCQLADAMVLQYYEEPDDLKAAFGHELTEDDWRRIGGVLGTYEELLFASPLLAANLAHPILEEFSAELTAPGRQFSFLCGHDSTITAFLAALGAEQYTLPGAIEPTTPIGVKVVFSRWLNGQGEAFYSVNMVYQSVEQLRSIQPLSLSIPPQIVPLHFEGLSENPDGLMPEGDVLNLFKEKINELYELELRYEEQEEDLSEAA